MNAHRNTENHQSRVPLTISKQTKASNKIKKVSSGRRNLFIPFRLLSVFLLRISLLSALPLLPNFYLSLSVYF